MESWDNPSSEFLSAPSSGVTRSAAGSSVRGVDISEWFVELCSAIDGSWLLVMTGAKVSLCVGEGEVMAETRLSIERDEGVRDSPRSSLEVAPSGPGLAVAGPGVVVSETLSLSPPRRARMSIGADEGVVSVWTVLERNSLLSDPSGSDVVGAAVTKPGRVRLLKNATRAARFTSLGVMLLRFIKPRKPLKSSKIVLMSSCEGVGRRISEESMSKVESSSDSVTKKCNIEILVPRLLSPRLPATLPCAVLVMFGEGVTAVLDDSSHTP